MKRTDAPLVVQIERGKLVISIGVDCLAHAIQWAPGLALHDESRGDFIYPKVTDPAAFAKEIVAALSREEEDGTTPVHQMLDAAAFHALKHGAEGIEMPELSEVATETGPRDTSQADEPA